MEHYCKAHIVAQYGSACLYIYIYVWFYAYYKYFDIIKNYLSSCTFTHLTKRNQSKAHILYTEWAPRGSPRPHG